MAVASDQRSGPRAPAPMVVRVWRSTVGKKTVMAVTGVIMLLYLVARMDLLGELVCCQSGQAASVSPIEKHQSPAGQSNICGSRRPIARSSQRAAKEARMLALQCPGRRGPSWRP